MLHPKLKTDDGEKGHWFASLTYFQQLSFPRYLHLLLQTLSDQLSDVQRCCRCGGGGVADVDDSF